MGAGRSPGTLVRYADDFVILCRTQAEAEAALGLAGQVLVEPGAGAAPGQDADRRAREGREGFDFLGCHFHARVSGRLLEQGIRRYYLQRWPSSRSMKRLRAKVKTLTGRNRTGVKDVRVLIGDLNPVLRGWGNYFRTGNAASKFRPGRPLRRGQAPSLPREASGRHLRPGQARQWTEDWFKGHGLYRLRGTIRYPEAA